MLLEHHVKQSLSAEMPEEWVNAMDALSEDEVAGGEKPRRKKRRKNRRKIDSLDIAVESNLEEVTQLDSNTGVGTPQLRNADPSSTSSEDDSD